MNNIVDDNKRMSLYLQEFYSCFSNGYDFEIFLKYYLFKIGLNDVVVTKKSRDGGIDLTAVRDGLSEFSNHVDKVKYIIQAKRKKPTTKIQSKEIDALRGVVDNGEKGLFIATCDYSKDAEKKANSVNYISRPIVLINGIQLIKSCIEHGIGFEQIPVINKDSIRTIIKNNTFNNKKTNILTPDEEVSLKVINRNISKNDIRAKILRLPSEVKDKIDLSSRTIKVKVNDDKYYDLTIDASKTYLAKVTELYKKYNLIMDNGVINNKVIKMFVKDGVLNLIFDE